jgi:hypothetical protein
LQETVAKILTGSVRLRAWVQSSVQFGDRADGFALLADAVLRPNLLGALIGKAAARTEIVSDRASTRHCTDFVVLANLVSAHDFRETELVKKDRTRLRKMLTYCRKDDSAMLVENAEEALDRLECAAKLND